MQNRFQSYIFDLYGTLSDIHTDEERPALWRAMANFYTLSGASYTPAELRETYLSLVQEEKTVLSAQRPEILGEYLEIELRHVFARLFLEKGIVASREQVELAARSFRSLSLLRLRPFPYAHELLRTLREQGKRVYLLSNAQSCFTLPELASMGLLPLFDGIMISSDEGIKKPSADFFERLLQRYAIDRERALMVGNDIFCDIDGAERAGLASAYLQTWQSPNCPTSFPPRCRPISDLAAVLELT